MPKSAEELKKALIETYIKPLQEKPIQEQLTPARLVTVMPLLTWQAIVQRAQVRSSSEDTIREIPDAKIKAQIKTLLKTYDQIAALKGFKVGESYYQRKEVRAALHSIVEDFTDMLRKEHRILRREREVRQAFLAKKEEWYLFDNDKCLYDRRFWGELPSTLGMLIPLRDRAIDLSMNDDNFIFPDVITWQLIDAAIRKDNKGQREVLRTVEQYYNKAAFRAATDFSYSVMLYASITLDERKLLKSPHSIGIMTKDRVIMATLFTLNKNFTEKYGKTFSEVKKDVELYKKTGLEKYVEQQFTEALRKNDLHQADTIFKGHARILTPHCVKSFHNAVERGQEPWVRFFLERGVDILAKDAAGFHVLAIATSLGRRRLMPYLKQQIIKAFDRIDLSTLKDILPYFQGTDADIILDAAFRAKDGGVFKACLDFAEQHLDTKKVLDKILLIDRKFFKDFMLEESRLYVHNAVDTLYQRGEAAYLKTKIEGATNRTKLGHILSLLPQDRRIASMGIKLLDEALQDKSAKDIRGLTWWAANVTEKGVFAEDEPEVKSYIAKVLVRGAILSRDIDILKKVQHWEMLAANKPAFTSTITFLADHCNNEIAICGLAHLLSRLPEKFSSDADKTYYQNTVLSALQTVATGGGMVEFTRVRETVAPKVPMLLNGLSQEQVNTYPQGIKLLLNGLMDWRKQEPTMEQKSLYLRTNYKLASARGNDVPINEALRSHQEEQNKLLLHGVKRRNLSEVKKALEAGANPNCRDTDKVLALHKAIHQGSKEIVVALLDAGADTEKTSRIRGFIKRFTTNAAYLAAKENNVNGIFDELLARGKVNPDKMIHDRSLITRAYDKGHKHAERLLQEANNRAYEGVARVTPAAGRGM